ADGAVAIAKQAGLAVDVRDEKRLHADGFGGVLAVGAGSARPPRVVEISYRPKRPTAHVALVGKGVTFDSGGLSLKRDESIAMMKTDMAGAAAVLGTMSALRD